MVLETPYERVPTYDSSFVGREEELDRLQEQFFRRGRMPSVVAVSGSAGIGKTAFLKAFFSRFRLDPPYWLDLHSEVDPSESIEAFLKHLFTTQPRRQSLVVLDGAEYMSSKSLEQALGQLFNWKATRTVFISRRKTFEISRDWATSAIELGPLSKQETIEAFQRSSGESLDLDQVEQLLQQTKGLPLAISILAALRSEANQSSLQIDGRLYDLSKTIAVPSNRVVELVRPEIITGSDELIRQLKKQPKAVYDLPPRVFEQVLADILVDMGWEVHLTQATRDGGKDILAYMNTSLGRLLCLVEAKRYSEHRKVGVDVVRTLFGTLCDHQANSGVLVTTSSFSRDAQEFRKRHKYQLGLRDYADVTRWIQDYGTTRRSSLITD